MKNPAFRKRNRNRNRTILCLLTAISYLLISGPAHADDDLLEQTRKNNERLYELKREREQRLADFVGGVYGSGGVVIDDTTALTDDGLVIADGENGLSPGAATTPVTATYTRVAAGSWSRMVTCFTAMASNSAPARSISEAEAAPPSSSAGQLAALVRP